MSSLRLALVVLGPTVAVVVAASCTPIDRPGAVDSGGAGGTTTSTLTGVQTTGAVMTTSTESTTGASVTTGTGMPSTSSGACPNTQTDPANCGVCGHDCNAQPNGGVATCANGVCAFSCSGGFLDCNVGAEDGCETDGTTDAKNCSMCGLSCGLTQTCIGSGCGDVFTSCAEAGNCPDPTCQELNRFSVNTDVAVDLQNLRALWQRSSKGPLTFVEATDYCANAAFSGVSGWRLPTSLELSNILNNAGGFDGCGAPSCNPAVDQAVFNDSYSDDYWTSDVGIPADSHICRSFCTGFEASYTTSAHYTRCTHDPLP
jgi:hypothetical protein